jgi:pimeloyl-ACP methyl ester carboxylesterase
VDPRAGLRGAIGRAFPVIADKVDPAEADRKSEELELMMHTNTATVDMTPIESAQEIVGRDTRTVLTDDGVSIAYRVVGTGPRNVLFLHGWGGAGSGHSWADVMPHLDLNGLRAILVDLRGHGLSEQTSKGFTTERFAQDVFTVADDAQADEFVLVAYSMSGKWAQWMSCIAPERVIGQVLVAPAPAIEIPIPDAEKERWLAVARSGDRDLFRDWIRAFSKEALPPAVVERYFNDVSRTPQETLAYTLDMCTHGAFMDRVQSIKTPTLVLAGKHDQILSPALLRETVVTPISGARLVVLDCGHEIPVEQPHLLAALLEAFIAGGAIGLG